MPLNLYVPVGIDIAHFLPANLKRYAAEALYLLHLIECRRVFYKNLRSDFIPIKAEYARNIVGTRNYKPIIKCLIHCGLIECDNHYIEGSKCMGYRLGEVLRDVEFKATNCPKKINNRLKKQETKLTLPIHQHLHHWLKKTKINYDDARDILVAEKATKENYSSIDMINNRDFWCIADAFGRVHTNVTSLKSSLRNCLRINKKEIKFIDIVNSQPFFLAVVIANWYMNDGKLSSFHSSCSSSNVSIWSNCDLSNNNTKITLNSSLNSSSYSSCFYAQKEGRGKVHPLRCVNREEIDLKHYKKQYNTTKKHIQYDNDSELCTPKSNNSRQLSKELKQLAKLDYPEDVKQYFQLTQQGKLYERLMEMWQCDRKEAKQRFFSHVLFCKIFDNEYREAFKQQFPNVLKVIDALKESDYCHAGQMLQRAESSVVIHQVCETMRIVTPDAPLLTIHDSVGTTDEFVDILQAAFAQAFKNLGLMPQFKI